MLRPFLLLAASALLARQVSTPPPSPAPQSGPAQSDRSGPLDDPGVRERNHRIKDLNDEIDRATKAGDHAHVEAVLREAVGLLDQPYLHVLLAQAIERTGGGRGREALTEYRMGIRGGGKSGAGAQDDPRVLAHYGDLCAEYKDAKEAVWAYTTAARRTRQVAGEARIKQDPMPDPPERGPLNALAAAAHMAAALEYDGHGASDAYRRELATALRLDPDSWVVHYYQAQDWAMHRFLFPKESPAREAALAERLAPTPEARKMVTELRRRERIPDLQGNVPPLLTVPGYVPPKGASGAPAR